nr:putative plant snare 11 [Quercus suber]
MSEKAFLGNRFWRGTCFNARAQEYGKVESHHIWLYSVSSKTLGCSVDEKRFHQVELKIASQGLEVEKIGFHVSKIFYCLSSFACLPKINDQRVEFICCSSKATVQDIINVGTATAAALKAQTEQMSRVVNELDYIHFSIKKASQLVMELGGQGLKIPMLRQWL